MGAVDEVKTRSGRLLDRMDSSSPRSQWLLVFVALLVVYLPTATWDMRVHVDAAMSALPAYTLAEHGTLDLASVEDLVANQSVARGQSVEVGEHRYSNRNPGAILVGVPAYAVRRVLFGPGDFSTGPAAVTAALVVAAAVATLSLALRRVAEPRHAVGFAFVAGLATPTWSVSADSMWSHGPNQFWLAVSMLLMARQAYARSGLAFGAAVFTRPYSAAAAAVSGIYLSAKTREWRPVVLIGLGSAAGMLAFVLYTRWLFGIWSVFGGYTDLGYHASALQSTNPSFLADLFMSLVSPTRGVLLHTAWAIPLLLGLRKAWRAAPDWVRAAALSGVAYWLLQMRSSRFQGDFFFGYRFQLEAIWLVMPLLLLAWREHVRDDPVLNRIFKALLVAAIALQILGAAVDIHKL